MTFKPIASINAVNWKDKRPLRLAILGATGSIGRQTIDIACEHPDLFNITVLSTNSKVKEALDLCEKVNPKILVICDEANRENHEQLLEHANPHLKVFFGQEAMTEVVCRDDVDMVVTATVGYSGLLPTLAAIDADKDIALANKETLVVAGDYIRNKLGSSKSRIFPIDSEHSAIVQCLRGEDIDKVSRLIITASGGPFKNHNSEVLRRVTASDALQHPNWDMGAKITIDSATMMNKAFEIVEAHYLFGLPSEKIDAVVHPQSVVHSMVEFKDGAIKAQLGVPDMHLPIAYALGLNNRLDKSAPSLTIEQMASLTFEVPDTLKFPCLNFARTILEKRGNTACIINAANEVAVAAFLKDELNFIEIPVVINKTLHKVEFIENPTLHELIETNRLSRKIAEELIVDNTY